MAEEKTTLARPYAEAAFEQARDEGRLDAWSEVLRFLRAVVSERTMAGIIADPRLERSKLEKLVLGIGEGRFSKTQANFVRLLVHYRRLALVPEIAALFERLRAEEEGRSRIEVISAFELEPKYREVIAEAVSKRLKQKVDVSVRIDESLIGGVVVRVGDLVIDASLRGRLNELASALA
ncbi:MAG: F0F1 ATP synthase subunit delta [Gammaproteobacteria bacterium]|nr:F0F1 ATP synthase subunit delta [Gammaproteobacteria bacterium]NIR83291.1 F0F1 ATP synthase subunit delta [Gammaproteobacteria bacterium]NIR91091.1 F0F1 ATP synthase subunit delta [Gammaproteobacteria bacterium]NIU04458.1 F0F1 ATP synthase subunit delta [Gammaproteobacteria bacterium]NIW87094.1 F0F1 ATP synthase subunit delta [Gammaproteobacteria bacterium]